MERRCACLVFQKLQGLFAGCPSSGPPHFPTSMSGPSGQVSNGPRACPTSGLSGFASPGLAEVRRSPARGAAAPGTPTRTPTEAGTLGAGLGPPQTWPTSLGSAAPRKREGGLVGPVWRGPWEEGTSQRGPWVIFLKRILNQFVREDTATRRHPKPGSVSSCAMGISCPVCKFLYNFS